MASSAYDYSFQTIDGAPLPMAAFKDKVVLGVPCNQFAGQEPGTEAEIKDFCETRFGVDFPLTAKAEVKGEGAHPFYQWAAAELGEPAVPVWNFHKILVGKDGKAIRAFGPRTEPLDAEVTGEIERAL